MSLRLVHFQVDVLDRFVETSSILLVSVPIACLNKATLADVALKGLLSSVEPYVVSNVAELLSSETALPAYQHLSFAASHLVNDDVPVVIGLYVCFHVLV